MIPCNPGDPLAPLWAAAPQLGLVLGEEIQHRFRVYLAALQQWNRRINLTGADDDRTIVCRHFLDSLSALPWLEEGVAHASPPTLIDIGTGAGFPGVPLQIARPTWRITLLEASRKRVHFLHHLCYELGLSEIQVLPGRAEEVGQVPAYREYFDGALARAVAELRVLVEYGLPLVRVGGYLVAYKGRAAPAECAGAAAAITCLGGGAPRLRPAAWTGAGESGSGTLVQIEKIQPTPPRYPRRPGVPLKRPLG